MKHEPIIPANDIDDGRSTRVVRGPYRVLVSEHFERGLVYVSIAHGTGNASAFLEPRAAMEVAKALLDGAARALEHQLHRQLGRQ